jgi:hypothetical protein
MMSFKWTIYPNGMGVCSRKTAGKFGQKGSQKKIIRPRWLTVRILSRVASESENEDTEASKLLASGTLSSYKEIMSEFFIHDRA